MDVTVSDGVLLDGPHAVEVILNAMPPRGAWLAEHFDAADLADADKETALWGWNADPDHDGASNLLEYALLGDPRQPSGVCFDTEFDAAEGMIRIRYSLALDRSDVRVVPRWSANLVDWQVFVDRPTGVPVDGVQAREVAIHILPDRLGPTGWVSLFVELLE